MRDENTIFRINDLKPVRQALSPELSWCQSLIHARLSEQLLPGIEAGMPDIVPDDPYGAFVTQQGCDARTRLTLCLAMIPEVAPALFDVLLQLNEQTQRPYTEFGLVEYDGIVRATGHTLGFLLGGDPLQSRLQVMRLLSGEAEPGEWLIRDNSPEATPVLWQRLQLRPEVLQQLLLPDMPARPTVINHLATRLETALCWHDLMLSEAVYRDLDEIELWLSYGERLGKEWQLAGKIREGFRALFYGPPGTGKTLTATLLGQRTNRPVYRVDIGAVTSKYIGETEKNLEQVFQQAERHHWLLFFDEADALFGQRVQTSGANDQFANQNVAYLLQRIESFGGIIILATNLQDNLDEAFFRRFESTVYFPRPDESVRLALWENALPPAKRTPDINLHQLACEYPFSGAEIINIVRYAALKVMSQDRERVSMAELALGIKKAQQMMQEGLLSAGRHSFF
ncbi:ATP-binding protein [Vibrio quintilis]|uniref:ATP-dependent zinc metalloprotease FtsH n=1 Tax=Vibrio quintilis TaxID=1117707 RepID=A0A1M7Z1B8_9VIBR|nr:ATP-binding protein [Vibrio quintilis]SHO58644.1 ATP-dependent zinc metalloprotease FtsH [Vibrio quintilis]